MLSLAVASVVVLVVVAPLAYYVLYRKRQKEQVYDRLDQVFSAVQVGPDWSSIKPDQYVHDSPRLLQ